MTKRMLVDGFHAEEIRVVIADDKNLLEFDIETTAKKQTKGNIFLAKVTRVEPSLQAAFVEYGSERQGFLPFSEIHPDYYQIPLADRQELLREEEEESAAEEAEEEAAEEAEKKPKRGGRFGRRRGKDGKDKEKPESVAEKVSEDGAEIVGEIALETEEAAEEVADAQDGQEAHEDAQEDAPEDEMEELGSDDPLEVQPKRQKSRRYKIQEVIKKNQIILIQVIKEERGNKGASVTSYISLAGRYCVLMPNSTKGGGVSRKINDGQERKRLKEVLSGLEMPRGMSMIMRTNGIGRSKPDITRDYNYLIRLWNLIRENTLKSVAPALVYEEGNVITRSLRDLYQADFEEVLVSGEDSHKIAKDFMKMIMPSHVKKVVKYEEKMPIFQKFGVESHLANMYDPIVPMASGGYIVINATEALISVDVNSGRSTGERNVEDTATAINIEAAEEVARQLRLRDLAGLVVIDFIDMLSSRHRRQVENALKSALKSDRAKIQVGRISPFGLLEMSRQRLRSSLAEMNMIECPTCKGIGIIRSPESAMIQILRAVESEISQSSNKVTKVILTTSAELALQFLNLKRKSISELEANYAFELVVETEHLPAAVFKIQLEWLDGNRSRIFASDEREGRLPQSIEGGKPKRRRGGKKFKNGREGGRDERRDGGNDDVKVVEQKITDGSNDNDRDMDAPEFEPDFEQDERGFDDSAAKPAAEKGERPKRSRNRRGGKNRKDADGETATAKPAPAQAKLEIVSVDDFKIAEEFVSKPAPKKTPKPKAMIEDLPPANVIVDESNVKEKKARKGGWWKKIVE